MCVPLSGGNWNNTNNAGAGAANFNNDAGNNNRNISARS